MRCLLAQRRAHSGPFTDDGVTLVELVMVMSLTLIISAMITSTFLTGMNAVFASDARGADTEQAKIATENTSKQLRLAVDPDGDGTLAAFDTASPKEVIFYAARRTPVVTTGGVTTGGVPTTPAKLHIWFGGDNVLRQQQALVTVSGSTVTYGAWDSTSTRVIGVNVVNSSSLPVFTYLKASDTTTNSGGVTISSLEDSSGSVTGSSLGDIEAVEIWVAINSNTSRTNNATTAVTRVTLLNR